MRGASVLVASALAMAGCASPQSEEVITQPRGWDFVESIGGMTVGVPYRDAERHVILPITCEFTGSARVAGLSCEPPLVRSEPGRILVTLCTSTATKKHHETKFPPADAGPLDAGSYEVIYRDPQGTEHPLRTVELRP